MLTRCCTHGTKTTSLALQSGTLVRCPHNQDPSLSISTLHLYLHWSTEITIQGDLLSCAMNVSARIYAMLYYRNTGPINWAKAALYAFQVSSINACNLSSS